MFSYTIEVKWFFFCQIYLVDRLVLVHVASCRLFYIINIIYILLCILHTFCLLLISGVEMHTLTLAGPKPFARISKIMCQTKRVALVLRVLNDISNSQQRQDSFHMYL